MKRLWCIVLLAALIGGCSLIDDDLSVCGTDLLVSYQMRLETNVQMTINEELALEIEAPIAAALKQWLSPMFSGKAHDLDMSFYSLDSLDRLRHHQSEVINAEQKSFTLYIPREDYMHMAVVNIADNAYMSLTDTQHSSTARLALSKLDTLPSQPTAVYTARLPMEMAKDTVEQYSVHLYMTNCAIALAIDTLRTPVEKIDVVLSGTASGFAIRDSVFTYDHPCLCRMEKVMERCYAAVTLPTRDSIVAEEKPAPIAHRSPSAISNPPALWEMRAYVTLPSGTVTETILSGSEPLRAGTLTIIRTNLNEDGALEPLDNSDVGATVTLDWKQGGEHNIDI